MHVVVLGAGIIGVSTAWHLLERGHTVVVVDRQPDAAMETSFANAAQISVSYCEPWAHSGAPLKALKWMFSDESPLLIRPQLDPAQWRWLLAFLMQCNDRAFERNVQQIVALGAYSHAALKDVVAATGIEFSRLERGIAHYFTDNAALDAAAGAAALMQKYGVQRRVVSRDELLRIEPAFAPFAHRIVGGTYTASDESGDARVFTQALAQRCEAKGAQFLYGHQVQQLHAEGGALASVVVRAGAFGTEQTLKADAFVAACGSYTAPLLRGIGVNLPIYPGKGYSATFKLLKPEAAPFVSTIDDEVKCAMTRLNGPTPEHPGFLRVAGTIELGGYDLSLTSPLARARCALLARRIKEVLPGVCDTRSEAEGGEPHFWTGLRPATPTNIPYIGQSPVRGLWVNAGHGTLGWTHGAGSGKALAELMSGRQPDMAFKFYGQAA